MFSAAVSLGPTLSAALLPIGPFFAADSFQSLISQGTDSLLFFL